jgi:hypothetical protein
MAETDRDRSPRREAAGRRSGTVFAAKTRPRELPAVLVTAWLARQDFRQAGGYAVEPGPGRNPLLEDEWLERLETKRVAITLTTGKAIVGWFALCGEGCFEVIGEARDGQSVLIHRHAVACIAEASAGKPDKPSKAGKRSKRRVRAG